MPKQKNKRTRGKGPVKNKNRQASVAFAKGEKALEKARKEFTLKKKRLLSKADIKTIASIIKEQKRLYYQAVVDANGDKYAIADLRKKFGENTRRLITKKIPNASKVRALNRQHSVSQNKLLKQHYRSNVDTGLNTVVEAADADLLEYDVFEPPFALSTFGPSFSGNLDAFVENNLGDLFPSNRCSIDPATGLIQTDFTFRDDDSWLWELIPGAIFWPNFSESYIAYLSTGVDYTVPVTGPLQISAVVQNLASRITMNVSDDFGFSYGEINIRHGISIMICRAPDWSFPLQFIIQDGVIAHETDFSHSSPELQRQFPYTVSRTSDEIFEAGTNLQIRVVAFTFFDSECDDTTNILDVKIDWQVKKLYVKAG